MAEGVARLDEAGVGTYIEVGPQPTLLGLVSACLPAASPVLLPSLRPAPWRPCGPPIPPWPGSPS